MRLLRWTALGAALMCARPAAAQLRSDLVSARAMGMGNAGMWLRDDAALFYNPAQLALARGVSLSGEYRTPREHGGALSSATSFGKGSVAVGMTMLQWTVKPVLITPDSITTGPAQPETNLLAAAGIGQTFKGQRIGIAAKYNSNQYGATRWSQALVDIGVAHDFGRHITAGVVAKDIELNGGPSYPWNPYRTVAGVAANGPLGPLDAVAALNMSNGPDVGWDTNVGVEAAWSWIAGYSVAARAGTLSPNGPQDHFTLGLGFTRDRVSIDYAFEKSYFGWNGHRIGLRVQ